MITTTPQIQTLANTLIPVADHVIADNVDTRRFASMTSKQRIPATRIAVYGQSTCELSEFLTTLNHILSHCETITEACRVFGRHTAPDKFTCGYVLGLVNYGGAYTAVMLSPIGADHKDDLEALKESIVD